MPSCNAAVRCLTFDVEDYFHIEAAHGCIRREDRAHWPARVERNVDRLLQLLADYDRPATWFVLGDVAKRHPHLARDIAAAGHEVACHGDQHDRLHRLTPETLRRDLLDAKHRLEDQIGCAVVGYRAPSFSLTRQTAWAIDVLLDAGFQYDSSLFPVNHPAYGVPEAPIRPCWIAPHANARQQLLEAPPLTWRSLGRNWPVAGGGYFRILPLWFMQRGLAQAARHQRPAVLYFHPWEFDPDTPNMPLSTLNHLRTYAGLTRTTSRLQRVIHGNAEWRRMIDTLPCFRQHAADHPPFTLAA